MQLTASEARERVGTLPKPKTGFKHSISSAFLFLYLNRLADRNSRSIRRRLLGSEDVSN